MSGDARDFGNIETRALIKFPSPPPPARQGAEGKKLTYMGFQCLDHPPYSTDLASSDYHLFPGLKNN
jgi:hypothetical protein